MELTFYGARGSYPIARKDQLRYGGNSTCLHFRTRSGQDLILDGGSGIRLLGEVMMHREYAEGKGEAKILVGHTHWDHILGYPFFQPFYRKGNRFLFVSAGQTGAHIREILSGQHDDIHFPVAFDALKAHFEYLTLPPGSSLTLGEFEIETVQLNHPGITLGYRVEADGVAIVVYTDNARVREVRLGDGQGGPKPDEGFTKEFLERLAHCGRKADLLVHDTHFMEHEMVGRYHWGHATVEDALEVARISEAKRLVLFHHAPEHSDAQVDDKLALARDLVRKDELTVDAAAENMRVRFEDRRSRKKCDEAHEEEVATGGEGAPEEAEG